MHKFWSIVKTLLPNNQKSNPPVSLTVDGTKVTDSAKIADCFNNHFCSIGKSLADNIDSSRPLSYSLYLQNRINASMFLRPTTAAEIYNLISHSSTNKSCEFDGINISVVKIATEILSPILAVLINACFGLGIFPSCLKIAKVVPVFKTGDKSKFLLLPILLLPVFSKVLKKIVYTRTNNFRNYHSVLTPTQCGFRSNSSTIHAVLDITTSCYDNIANNLFTGLVFLDLAKALDTVNRNILLKKLDHYGIRGTVNDFFRSCLTNRSQFVSINSSTSSLMSINVGVPQGSTLGPLLLLLYVNDLPNSGKNVPSLFANDTCLLVGAPSVVHLENQLNSELIKIFNWLVDNKLTLNTSKSCALVITPKLRCPSVS